jgi:hypothetical protein
MMRRSRAESRIRGARGGLTRLDHRHPEPLAALASLAALSLARTLVVARTHPAPARQMARSWKTTHVDATMAKQFKLTKSKARDCIRAARSGYRFLSGTKQGQRGGELTPEAMEVLRAARFRRV